MFHFPRWLRIGPRRSAASTRARRAVSPQNRRLSGVIERLEERTLLAYAAALTMCGIGGVCVTFTGDAAGDVLTFDLDASGNLRHDRFAASDAGFSSAIDLDSTVPDTQSMSIASLDGITVNAGGGDDVINIGNAATPASSLTAAILVNGQSGADTLTVNNAADAIGRTATLSDTSISGIGGGTSFGTVNSLVIGFGSAADILTVVEPITTAAVTVLGGEGDDTIALGDGATMAGMIDGQPGHDTLSYSAYTTSVTVDLATGSAIGINGFGAGAVVNIETVLGGAGNDTLSGTINDDALNGGPGNDVLVGGAGADSLAGGANDDTLTGGPGNDSIDGGAGTDQLTESADVDFTLTATSMGGGLGSDAVLNIEQASLTGGAGNNIIDASAFNGPVTLFGGRGNDSLIGGGAGDSLSGGDGNDTLRGGTDNDTLAGGAGNDSLDGGGGINTADFSAATHGVTVKLKNGSAKGDGKDRLVAVENVIGTGFNDHLQGDDFANRLVGGFGNDQITAFDGDDTINGDQGDDKLDGGLGNDIVIGGAGNDMLNGDVGRDLVIGGQGADRILGGPDSDLLVAGTTDFDAVDDALRAILAEWTAARNYDTRIANLRDGSGSVDRLNGSVFLSATTTHDDQIVDTLTGAVGVEWFFIRTTDPVRDVITDRANGVETVDPLT